jgi:hypothetical protein
MTARNLALEALRSVLDRPDTSESYDAMMVRVQAAIAALEAETDDWQLVPRRLSVEMWKAGLPNLFRDVDGVWSAILEAAPKP